MRTPDPVPTTASENHKLKNQNTPKRHKTLAEDLAEIMNSSSSNTFKRKLFCLKKKKKDFVKCQILKVFEKIKTNRENVKLNSNLFK